MANAWESAPVIQSQGWETAPVVSAKYNDVPVPSPEFQGAVDAGIQPNDPKFMEYVKSHAAPEPKPQSEFSKDNLLGNAIGAFEAPLSVASSVVLSPFAAAYGLTGGNDVREQNKRIDQVMNHAYQPVTNTGRDLVNKFSRAVDDSGIQGIAPTSELSIIGAAAPAVQSVNDIPVVGPAVNAGNKLLSGAGQAVNDVRTAAAQKLMKSAVKPTIAQWKSGDAQTAIDTLLQNGINPTKGGVEKLRNALDDLNDQISTRIQNSSATVSKKSALNALADVKDQFSNQVSPTSDINAIQGVADDFANHPLYPGDSIPVQDAQAMKQGTYRVLSKKYGQMGGAETEAQKGLARGLKEQISDAVPDVGELNAKESALIKTLNVTERRALMDMNKNPMGLAALAHNPVSWAAFMADKSALFKSLVARKIYPAQKAANPLSDIRSIPAPQYQLLEQYAPQLLPPASVNQQNELSQPR